MYNRNFNRSKQTGLKKTYTTDRNFNTLLYYCYIIVVVVVVIIIIIIIIRSWGEGSWTH